MESTIEPITNQIDESAIVIPQNKMNEMSCSKSLNRFVKKNSSEKVLSPDSPLRYLDTMDLPRYAQPTVSFQLRVSLSHCSNENSPTNLPTCSRYHMDVPSPMLTSTNERRSRSVEPTICARTNHIHQQLDRHHHHRTPRVTKRCTSSAALVSSTPLPSPIDQRGVPHSAPNVNRTRFIKSRLNASQTSDDHINSKDEGRVSSVSVDKMSRQPRNATPNPKKSSSVDNFRIRAASADRFLEKRLAKDRSKALKPPIAPNVMSRSTIAQSTLSDKNKTAKKEAKTETFKDKLIGQAKDVISKITAPDSKPTEPKKNETKIKVISKQIEVKDRDSSKEPKRQDAKHKDEKLKLTGDKMLDIKVKSAEGKSGEVKLRSEEAKSSEVKPANVKPKSNEIKSNETKPKSNEIKLNDSKPKSNESKSHEPKPKLSDVKPNDTKAKAGDGKDENIDDYKAKLAEKRRLAREKQERDVEEERLKQIRIKEEETERQRIEEEAEERRMREEIRLTDAARAAEQERLQQLTIEEEERRKLEAERMEAETQLKREQEKIKKEEAEQVEEARRIRINKEELEKIERKKRLENIMKRVKPEDKKSDETLGLEEAQAITIMQDMVGEALASDDGLRADVQPESGENSSTEVQKLVSLRENKLMSEVGKQKLGDNSDVDTLMHNKVGEALALDDGLRVDVQSKVNLSNEAQKLDDTNMSHENELKIEVSKQKLDNNSDVDTSERQIVDEISNNLISTDGGDHSTNKNETTDQTK